METAKRIARATLLQCIAVVDRGWHSHRDLSGSLRARCKYNRKNLTRPSGGEPEPEVALLVPLTRAVPENCQHDDKEDAHCGDQSKEKYLIDLPAIPIRHSFSKLPQANTMKRSGVTNGGGPGRQCQ